MTMIRYARAANNSGYRNDAGLTLGEVRRVAPSALTAEAHPDRSDKYAVVSTRDMVVGLREAGFLPVEIRQNRVMTKDRREYAQHMVKLRHQGGRVVGGVAQEVILTNSHDGTSSFRMLAGYFRFVCSNGLVMGDIEADVRIAHRGDAVQRAQEEATRLIERARESSLRIEAMRARILTPIEQSALAVRAARVRWGNDLPLNPTRLLEARRYSDVHDDLWSVFNRIQENVIRGGTPAVASTGRRMTTRPITSIVEDVRINRELWAAADELVSA